MPRFRDRLRDDGDGLDRFAESRRVAEDGAPRPRVPGRTPPHEVLLMRRQSIPKVSRHVIRRLELARNNNRRARVRRAVVGAVRGVNRVALRLGATKNSRKTGVPPSGAARGGVRAADTSSPSLTSPIVALRATKAAPGRGALVRRGGAPRIFSLAAAALRRSKKTSKHGWGLIGRVGLNQAFCLDVTRPF